MKNFHLPLPEKTYARLREEAERTIAACAAEMAGTHLDLDDGLESAGIEHLLQTSKDRPTPRNPRIPRRFQPGSPMEIDHRGPMKAAMDLD